jgi:DNA repair protein RadD
MIDLRGYQWDGIAAIRSQWTMGLRNVAYVLPTGGGKTVLFSKILSDHVGASVAIAHRQELVGQISVSLGRFGIRHRIIAPRSVIKLIMDQHRRELGGTFYDPASPVGVAGVDTLVRRRTSLASWMQQVTLWTTDEMHHVLRSNKWGKAIELFPNARGLGVTATAGRLDGKGLGRHADGWFDSLIIGPTMRELIHAGYLADYRIFAPPSDLDLADVRVDRGGDYNRDDLRRSVHRSRIVGDVVDHYSRIANGKLGVTFATDVETAMEITARYNAFGIPAAMVNAKTPGGDRARILAQFRDRQLLNLVNVDLFGEGFDVPSIEVVSMARPTQSAAVYMQQFGRALRPLPGKDAGIIIDHVGNVQRHRLPDAVRTWTLDARERGKRTAHDPDAIPVTTCTECFRVYEAVNRKCPYCGAVPMPVSRSRPEYVDGDLLEMDAKALAAMRGDVSRIDGPALIPNGVNGIVAAAIRSKWHNRQQAQENLRNSIAQWAGELHAAGLPDSEIYRRFYFRFGTDIMTAQTLGRPEAEELARRVDCG